MIQPPDGGVVLGLGGTFKVPGDSKQKIRCWAYNPNIGKRWISGWWRVNDPEYLFAAPISSEIALLNGHETLLKCTRCRKTSLVDPDKLVCPHCGEDYSAGKVESDTPMVDSEERKGPLRAFIKSECVEGETYVRESDHAARLSASHAVIRELRAIFPAVCEALGNGACCTGDNSIEFLIEIPKEVALVIKGKDALIGRLRDSLRRLCDREQEFWAHDEAKGIGLRDDLRIAREALTLEEEDAKTEGETPLTDSFAKEKANSTGLATAYVECLNHARRLETSLSAASEDVEHYKFIATQSANTLSQIKKTYGLGERNVMKEMQAELTAARAEVERVRKEGKEWIKIAEQVTLEKNAVFDELTALRAENERLRDGLLNVKRSTSLIVAFEFANRALLPAAPTEPTDKEA